jgi:HEXXH motif-containing protein
VIAYHDVPAARFAALASGLGGAAAVAELAAAQNSKRRLLLRHLLHARPGGDAGPVADVLIRADRRDRRAVDDLLSAPLVGAWAIATVRRLVHRADAGRALQPDLAQLGSLAAAAALRTGQDADLGTWALEGRVTLPTLGTALLGSDGPAVVAVSGGTGAIFNSRDRVRVADDDPRWLPLRRLTAQDNGLAGTAAIEDCNPYRDGYHAPPAQRLNRDEVGRWQELFRQAWSLLARHLPMRAVELSAGLRSLIPLASDDSDLARSGTARDSFGAMGLTRPRSASDFAITLVHEFQHSKLSGLLDLIPLTAPGGQERHFAPWRADPRPTAGLLQGVYAFTGIADSWRGLRAAPGLEDEAVREFAAVRRLVDVGLAALEGSTELTAMGHEFVAHLRVTVDRLLAEPVPAAAEAAARAALAECQRGWEERNRVSGPPVDPRTIASAATAGRDTAAA